MSFKTPKSWFRDITSLTEKDIEEIQKNVILSLNMSATNRGAVKIESDFYSTPLKSFNPLLPFLPKGKKIWEPAQGDGRLVKRMLDFGLDASGDDLNNGYNFLHDQEKKDVILTNPPFSIAKAFITHALELSDEVYMLLRLSFFESRERKGFWIKNKPSRIFVLSDRPNFVMHVKCKNKDCRHKRFIPIESIRPKECSVCNGKVAITTSDNSGYMWVNWSKNKYEDFIHWI